MPTRAGALASRVAWPGEGLPVRLPRESRARRLGAKRLGAECLGSQRERDAERGAAARRRLDAHPAAMGHDEGGHDGEAEPAAARLPGPGLVGAVKPLERAFCLLGRKSRAPVGNLKDDGRG